MSKWNVAVLVYTMVTIQVIGYSFLALHEGSNLASYLFLYTDLGRFTRSSLNHGIVLMMLLGLTWIFFRWSPRPFLGLGALFLLESLSRSLLGVGFEPERAMFVEATRYLWLLAMGYALVLHRTMDCHRMWSALPLLLRAGLAITLITQGIEALQLTARSAQDLFLIPTKLLPFVPTETLSQLLLVCLTVVNIGGGLWILWRPQRSVLLSLSFWGLLTALSRIMLVPEGGLYEAMLRVSHWGIPLLVISLEAAQRSQVSRVSPITFVRRLKI